MIDLEKVKNCFALYFNAYYRRDYFIPQREFNLVKNNLFRVLDSGNVNSFQFWYNLFYREWLVPDAAGIPEIDQKSLKSGYFKYIILRTFSEVVVKNGSMHANSFDELEFEEIECPGLLSYFKVIFDNKESDDSSKLFDNYDFSDFSNDTKETIKEFRHKCLPYYQIDASGLSDFYSLKWDDKIGLQNASTEKIKAVIENLNKNDFIKLFKSLNRTDKELKKYIGILTGEINSRKQVQEYKPNDATRYNFQQGRIELKVHDMTKVKGNKKGKNYNHIKALYNLLKNCIDDPYDNESAFIDFFSGKPTNNIQMNYLTSNINGYVWVIPFIIGKLINENKLIIKDRNNFSKQNIIKEYFRIDGKEFTHNQVGSLKIGGKKAQILKGEISDIIKKIYSPILKEVK